MPFKRLIEALGKIVIDDEKRRNFQARLIYLCFVGIAFVMSVINVITAQGMLLCATGSFCVLCALNFVLNRFVKNGARVAEDLFVLEVILLFSYFIATGGTEGFSVIWLLLLPTVGLFFFGFTKGTVMSAAILVIMLIFFQVPVPALRGHALKIYTETFVTRFPVVFICAYVTSLLLESVRYATARQMTDAREKYQQLYNHDALTGAFNRHAINERLKFLLEEGWKEIGVMILDIDLFKNVNDTYGHPDGDLVLKQLVETISEQVPADAIVCRWGGEEFAVLFRDIQSAPLYAGRILQMVREREFILSRDTIHVTVSIGLALSRRCSGLDDYERMVVLADECLYQAKNHGRDRLVVREDPLNGEA